MRRKHCIFIAAAVIALLFVGYLLRSKEVPFQWQLESEDRIAEYYLPGIIWASDPAQAKPLVSFPFELVNATDEPLHVIEVQPSCSCLTANLPMPMVLAPRERQYGSLALNPSKVSAGLFQLQIALKCEGGAARILKVYGTGVSPEGLFPLPKSIELGNVFDRFVSEREIIGDAGGLSQLEVRSSVAAIRASLGPSEAYVPQAKNSDMPVLFRRILRIEGSDLAELKSPAALEFHLGSRQLQSASLFWAVVPTDGLYRSVFLGRLADRKRVEVTLEGLSLGEFKLKSDGNFDIGDVLDHKIVIGNLSMPAGFCTGRIDLIDFTTNQTRGAVVWTALLEDQK